MLLKASILIKSSANLQIYKGNGTNRTCSPPAVTKPIIFNYGHRILIYAMSHNSWSQTYFFDTIRSLGNTEINYGVTIYIFNKLFIFNSSIKSYYYWVIYLKVLSAVIFNFQTIYFHVCLNPSTTFWTTLETHAPPEPNVLRENRFEN